jgi:hypothetical protein
VISGQLCKTLEFRADLNPTKPPSVRHCLRSFLNVSDPVSNPYIRKIISATRFWAGPGSSVGIPTELRAGRSGDRIPVVARFFAHVQTGPGAHPDFCTMGTGSFPGVNSRCVVLTSHPLLAPRLRMSRAIPLLPL